ncbi:MAG: tRNA pseudouridine(13) synthase TruD [Candidatus Thiodiazotropha sp.]
MSERAWQTLDEMPGASGAPLGFGQVRAVAEDFQVDEVLGFEADGEGEHVLLHVRKRNTNTQWLAGELARWAGIPPGEVSYAGLKDRHAVTTQWFSLRMPGQAEPDWKGFENDQVEVLAAHRHRRKLRRGALQGNRFQLRIRALNAEPEKLESRLQHLRNTGMPNYFGEQRFGHGYQNLERAAEVFSRHRRRVSRNLRGLIISAVRSQLFNQVLAARIARGDWNKPVPGDYFMLEGSRSGFTDDREDTERLMLRCEQQDIHPTGPLWGRGRPLINDQAEALEQETLSPFDEWRNGLEHVGLAQERRALRVCLPDLAWSFEPGDELVLKFFLPAGCYATVLLRELIQIQYPEE